MLLLSGLPFLVLLIQVQSGALTLEFQKTGYLAFLYTVGEDQWVRLIWAMAIATGALVATSALLNLNVVNKAIANFSVGFLSFIVMMMWLQSIPFTTLSTYGILPNPWMVLSPIIALAIATFAGIATAPLIWRRSDRLTTAWVCLTSGLGAFGLCGYSLMLSLLFLGVAD
jgi:hypothetical protein